MGVVPAGRGGGIDLNSAPVGAPLASKRWSIEASRAAILIIGTPDDNEGPVVESGTAGSYWSPDVVILT